MCVCVFAIQWSNHIFQWGCVILCLSSLHIPHAFKHLQIASESNTVGKRDKASVVLVLLWGIPRETFRFNRCWTSGALFASLCVTEEDEALPETHTMKPQIPKVTSPVLWRLFCTCAVLLCDAASAEKTPVFLCRRAQSTLEWMSKEGMGLICLAGVLQEL